MTGWRISGGRFSARLKAAPRAAAIGIAVAVVVVAALVSALVAPGGGGDGTAAAASGKNLGQTGSATPHSPSAAPTVTPTSATPAVPPVPASIQHATESGGKAVNITIDDGPDPIWTPKVLDVLKKHHVHATFCMIGPQAQANPALVRRVVAEGHRLCDHTVHHDEAMDHKPFAYQQKEILDAYAMIEQASGGAPVRYYRAPGGAFTPASRELAAQHGMRPLGWNVDTKDFSRPGVGAIVGTVKAEIHNGPTILFHDGGGNRSQTVEALDQTLTWLAQQHYATSFPKVD
ncbi:polysaccharide deacetylase family protein [Actinacidiphila epipremni]|uniref:Polysaccharide deacetylase family protein n=1 Tax=Actinacidiphila epipremni TaxID=2053013 RepID=A0ABX0ZJ84_9ACTN|nr:polysaccharide deacetylase family protein [Actinacidiphila epipremni]NJP43924.1 polysaccharide deacetylase family protein [Actinacidiphila epipremni]